MRVLVTGAAGFIGRHVMGVLRREQMDPAAFKGDVRDPKAWTDLNDLDVDVVIHLAARVGTGESMYRAEAYADVNVRGTGVMLDALADSPVSRVVLASSSAVYGEGDCLREGQPCRPVSIYGVTKLAQEQMVMRWAEATGRSAAALRLFCVYGPGQSLSNPYSGLVGMMASQLLAGHSPQLFEDGGQTRDLIHVSDVAAAFVTAAFGRFEGTVNVASGDATRLIDLVQTLRGYLCGLTGPEITLLHKRRAGDVRDAVADIGLMRSLGLVNAVGLERGLFDFCQWAKRQTPGDVSAGVAELQERGLVA